MARVTAITAQKGGVSKTTTAVNLSVAFSILGKKVLLVDLDPQANATMHVGIEPSSTAGKGTYEVFTRKIHIAGAVRHSIRPNLDLVPACETMANVELEVAGWIGREKLLANQIALVKSQYDFIILDCPPGMGLVTANAFAASDDLLLIVQPEKFAVAGLNLFQRLYEDVRANCQPNLAVKGLLLTMIDGKQRGQMAVHRDYAKALREAYGDLVFKTQIRTSVRIKEAQGHSRTIFDHAPESTGAVDYLNLAKEICGHDRLNEGAEAGRTASDDAEVHAA
jgi:chromosome partitioning protein